MKKAHLSAAMFVALLTIALLELFYPAFTEDIEILNAYYSLDGQELVEYLEGKPVRVPFRAGGAFRWVQYLRTSADVAVVEVEEMSQIPGNLTQKNVDTLKSSKLTDEVRKTGNGVAYRIRLPMKPEWEGYGHIIGGIQIEDSDGPGFHKIRLRFKNGQTRGFWFEVVPPGRREKEI